MALLFWSRIKFDAVAMNVTAWSNMFKTMFKPGGIKALNATGDDYEGFNPSTNFWHLGLSGLTYFNSRKCFITMQYELFKDGHGPWAKKAPTAWLDGVAAQANTSPEEIKTRYLLVAFDNENDTDESADSDDDSDGSDGELERLEAQLAATKKVLHHKRKRGLKHHRDKLRVKRSLMRTRIALMRFNDEDRTEVPETDMGEATGDEDDDQGDDEGSGDEDDGFDGSPPTRVDDTPEKRVRGGRHRGDGDQGQDDEDQDDGDSHHEDNGKPSYLSILPNTRRKGSVTRQHGNPTATASRSQHSPTGGTGSSSRIRRKRKRFVDEWPDETVSQGTAWAGQDEEADDCEDKGDASEDTAAQDQEADDHEHKAGSDSGNGANTRAIQTTVGTTRKRKVKVANGPERGGDGQPKLKHKKKGKNKIRNTAPVEDADEHKVDGQPKLKLKKKGKNKICNTVPVEDAGEHEVDRRSKPKPKKRDKNKICNTVAVEDADENESDRPVLSLLTARREKKSRLEEMQRRYAAKMESEGYERSSFD